MLMTRRSPLMSALENSLKVVTFSFGVCVVTSMWMEKHDQRLGSQSVIREYFRFRTSNSCLHFHIPRFNLRNSAFLSLHQWLQEVLEYSHVPGHAILHAGRHRHGAKAITSGQRTNLILWCRRWVSLPVSIHHSLFQHDFKCDILTTCFGSLVLASWVLANNMTTSFHWFQRYYREWGHRLAYHWLPLCFEPIFIYLSAPTVQVDSHCHS